jgi:hypothetical protein
LEALTARLLCGGGAEPRISAIFQAMSAKTHSESLFEEYLGSLPVEFRFEPEVAGRAKRPDYRVEMDREPIWFEVKELDDPETVPAGSYDPTEPYEEKIDRARKKFKEFKDECCVLVLHGCKSIFRRPMIPEIVSAAFGEKVTLEPSCGQTVVDEPLRFKFGGKAKLRADVNTTISAIVILQHFELESRWIEAFYRVRARMDRGEEVGPFAYAEEFDLMKDLENRIEFGGSVRAVILENPYARIRYPDGPFLGRLDQRWGIKDSLGWYTLVSMGSELEQLRGRGKAVPYMLI